MDNFQQEFYLDAETENEDDIPDVNEENVITQEGDLWTLGRLRLLCGDCTVKENVDKLMGNDKADMVFTDPPYGMNLDTDYKEYSKYTSPNKSMTGATNSRTYKNIIGDDKEFNPGFILDYFKTIKEMFLFGADYYMDKIIDSKRGSLLVWDKRSNDDTSVAVVRQRDKIIGNAFEVIWSKSKHTKKFIRIMWTGVFGTEKEWRSGRHHPTQKPIRLYEWIMNRYSKKNEIIWDGYLGSGTTIIAAEKTDRTCYGMEIDPQYCDVILKRYVDFTGDDPDRQDGVKFSELK